MKCCVQCFDDEYLIELIDQDGELGDCDFCGSKNIKTVEAHILSGEFYQLISLYASVKDKSDFSESVLVHAKSLAECIENDFKIFSKKLTIEKRNLLLDKIRFNDGEQILSGRSSKDNWLNWKWSKWVPAIEKDVWNEFVSYIKHKRRFHITDENVISPVRWLPKLLDKTKLIPSAKQIFFRAKTGIKTLQEMGPRPCHEVKKGGRANPAGISYLYVANEERTAIAEARPYVGEKVTIASFRIKRKLTIANLIHHYQEDCPFGDNLDERLAGNNLLNILNEEISKPINPNDSEIEYIPTQYLAEIILDNGYDGIRYKSSVVSDGYNIVFFNPEDLEQNTQTRVVTVTGMNFDYKPS